MSKNKAVIETQIRALFLENKTILADAKKIAPTRRLYLIDPKNEATALMKAIANGQLRGIEIAPVTVLPAKCRDSAFSGNASAGYDKNTI